MQIQGPNIGRPIEFSIGMWTRVIDKSLVAMPRSRATLFSTAPLSTTNIQVADHPGAETVFRKDHQKGSSLDEEGFGSRFV